jgi:simple sugar transport system permease protein
MLGINVKRTRFFSYVLCGLLSGIAGYAFIMQTGAGNVGNASGFEMKAIASSIIGGTLLTGGVGNMIGSPIGALSLLVINEIIRAAGINSNYQAIISGLLLCLFIVLQSAVIWIRANRRPKPAAQSEAEKEKPPAEAAIAGEVKPDEPAEALQETELEESAESSPEAGDEEV